MILLVLAAALTCTPQAKVNPGLINDGPPPKRYQCDPKQPFTVVIKSVEEIQTICAEGQPPICSTHIDACTLIENGKPVIYMQNPRKDGRFRVTFEHELAHAACGWPADHPQQ